MTGVCSALPYGRLSSTNLIRLIYVALFVYEVITFAVLMDVESYEQAKRKSTLLFKNKQQYRPTLDGTETNDKLLI
jgi:hypothetical protein